MRMPLPKVVEWSSREALAGGLRAGMRTTRLQEVYYYHLRSCQSKTSGHDQVRSTLRRQYDGRLGSAKTAWIRETGLGGSSTRGWSLRLFGLILCAVINGNSRSILIYFMDDESARLSAFDSSHLDLLPQNISVCRSQHKWKSQDWLSVLLGWQPCSTCVSKASIFWNKAKTSRGITPYWWPVIAQRATFTIWGDAVGLSASKDPNHDILPFDSELRSVVEGHLDCISLLFEDATQLSKKYGL